MPASDRQKSPGVTSSPTKQKLHFNTYGGPDGPKPILENVKYAKTSQTVVRHQTRPIGEFGGNFGTGFWTIAIPVIIWYVYGIVVMNEGNLQIPDRAFGKSSFMIFRMALPSDLRGKDCTLSGSGSSGKVSVRWCCLAAKILREGLTSKV